MRITRRLFLRSTGAAGAIGAGMGAGAVALSTRDQAVWHMRELERLAIADGAASAFVSVLGRSHDDGGFKAMMIDHGGNLHDDDGMFGGSNG